MATKSWKWFKSGTKETTCGKEMKWRKCHLFVLLRMCTISCELKSNKRETLHSSQQQSCGPRITMAGLGTVVIGGGTGFIGSALVEAFKAIGSKVWVISRMPDVSAFTWDELNKEGFPEDTRIVINVAGQNILDPFRGWSAGFQQNVYSSRINTTRALGNAIIRASVPPKVFVTISGVGIYPFSDTIEYDEDWKPKSDSKSKSDQYAAPPPNAGIEEYFGTLVTHWEGAGELPQGHPTRRVIIRSGVVLGNGGGMIKNVYLPFYLGVGGPIASGNQYFPWIHLSDMVRLFMFASEADHVNGILNGVSPQVITNAQFTKALGKAMWRPTVLPLPEFAVKLAFGPERASMMTKGMKVVPKRTLEMGYKYVLGDINDACKDLAK